MPDVRGEVAVAVVELVDGMTGGAARLLAALLPYLLGLSVVAALVLGRACAVVQPHRPLPEVGAREDLAAAA